MKVAKGSFYSGLAGNVTEILYELETSDPRDWTAGVSCWFIHAPGQSPAWNHYMLTCIHLRPIEGVRAPVKAFPEATHEFMVLAMDPEKKPEALAPRTWSYLAPLNLAAQIALRSDSQASQLTTMCAQAVARGVLWAEPPLQGQNEPWVSFLHHWATERAHQS